MRALVVGWGVTGRSVCRYLRGRGAEVTVVEDHPGRESAEQVAAGGAVLVAAPALAELVALVAASDVVVPSPGVPAAHPVHQAALAAGVPVRSEIELAWRRLASDPGPSGVRPRLVAITGTNGKTTVTTMVAAILTASGRRAIAAGNIGLPLLDAVGQATDVVVAEVSSFQLEHTDSFRPDVSCWLNLAEDHLDWHPTMAHYAAAKARIWAAQGPGDVAVLGADDPVVMAAADDPRSGVPAGVDRRTFSVSGAADYRVDARRGLLVGPDPVPSVGPDPVPSVGPGLVPLVAIGALRRAMPHDLANAAAAAACALAVGATVEGCRLALGQFETLPHRVELIGEAEGVRWYDDSKATTPASVLAATAGFDSVVLIAGGRNKGLHLDVLADAVPPVHTVVAIGEAAAEVAHAFGGRVEVVVAGSMADAVTAAGARARSGDAVLLSPGCASFDWYRSYAERGDDFRSLVTARIEKGRDR